MYVEHFYLVAAYVLWAYILLCIVWKLKKDDREFKREEERKGLIRQFFSAKTSYESKRGLERKMRRYSKNNILLDYMLLRYAAEKGHYFNRDVRRYEDFVYGLIHRRIGRTRQTEMLNRGFLFTVIQRGNFHSEKIYEFFMECKEESRLCNLLKKSEREEKKVNTAARL